MTGARDGAILEPIRALFEAGGAGGSSDGELLERFGAGGPGAEAAFSVLLERHGPMVLAVCRRLTGDRNAADDAFQATFLAFLKRSASIRVRGSLAPWLFAVARRISQRARRRAEGRREAPCPVAFEAIDPTSPAESHERDETSRILFEEIGRLPERYRAPVVLCHVEGRTHDQAAIDLGWPVGTVRGRLSRARVLLKGRLERRGVGVLAGALLVGIGREASAAVPSALRRATQAIAGSWLSMGTKAIGTVPIAIGVLASGGRGTMLLMTSKSVVVGALVLSFTTVGAVLGVASASGHSAFGQESPPKTVATRFGSGPRSGLDDGAG